MNRTQEFLPAPLVLSLCLQTLRPPELEQRQTSIGPRQTLFSDVTKTYIVSPILNNLLGKVYDS